MNDEEKDITARVNMHFYHVVYEWANLKTFSEIKSLTDIDEGMIVRMFMSLDQICKSVKYAA